MKIIYHNSSTVSVIEKNTRIVCDPWIYDGEYYGSWFHYPKYEIDKSIFNCSAIYISHIHGDHLSEKSLKKFNKDIPVYIHKYKSPFVKIKLNILGFKNIIELAHTAEANIGDIDLKIFSADNCNPELCGKYIGCAKIEDDFEFTQIDSLSLFKSKITNETVLNLNDCPFGLASEVIKKHITNKFKIDLLLVGYAGAGPYPQCFEFKNDYLKNEAAQSKKKMFIDQALSYINLVKPKFYMPYAGTYILGGKFHNLNHFRGVPTRDEALDIIKKNYGGKSIGFILKSNDSFNFKDLPSYQIKENPYDYIDSIKNHKYTYESTELPTMEHLNELIQKAVKRYHSVRKKIKFNSKTPLVIEVFNKFFVISNEHDTLNLLDFENFKKISEYVKISMDPKLLKLCLMGPRYGHYDNAEIGSHINYERKPDKYDRALYYCLNFLHC